MTKGSQHPKPLGRLVTPGFEMVSILEKIIVFLIEIKSPLNRGGGWET
jgi:hypothetical protein